jgi:hypothetical protein
MDHIVAEKKNLPRGKLVKASVAGPKMGMTDQFLQRRCQSGKSPVPFWHIDGNYLFDTADIEDYLHAVYVPAGN